MSFLDVCSLFYCSDSYSNTGTGKSQGKISTRRKKSANRTTESIEFTGITVLSKLFVKSDQKGCAVVSGEWICYNEKA